jgi:hypothetical protein
MRLPLPIAAMFLNNSRALLGGTTGPVASVTIVGALNDTATATRAPAVTNGQNIPIDSAGWVLLIQCSGAQTIADATKMTVNIRRPGNTSGTGDAPTTRTDVAYGTIVLRRAWPNEGSPLIAPANGFYVCVDNLLHDSDQIESITLAPGFFTGQTDAIPIGPGLVTNSSGTAYAKPMLRPITPPWRRAGGSSIDIEFAAINEWAAFGSQLARVEARAVIGGNVGPWAGSGGTMVRSVETPTSGRLPPREAIGQANSFGLPVYRVTVDLSFTAANSASRTDTYIEYRGYSWYGDVVFDSATDGDPLNSSGLFSSLNPPARLPFVKDTAGSHAPIYAWINRDGTAGGSAAIQTGTSDPGAAASYASENAALTAARAYNNANRGHNTTSGIILLFRDVAGGSLGNSDLAYWQRATMAGFSDGLVPPVLASASYLASGTTTLDCRRRGVQDNGTTVATSKIVSGIYEWRGITFDSIGLTGVNHIILDGSTAGRGTTANATTGQGIFIDCDVRESSAGGSANAACLSMGFRYDIRVDQGGLNASEGPPGAASMGYTPTFFAGLTISVGSLYSRNAFSAGCVCAPAGLFACWFRNVLVSSQARGLQPQIECGMMYHVRIDVASPTTAVWGMSDRPVTKGFGACGVMVRTTGTYSGPIVRLWGDGNKTVLNNVVLQHIGVDAGFDSNVDRGNLAYNDSGFLGIIKRASLRASALGSFNIKDDTFPTVGENASTYNEGGWAATTQFYRGDLIHDNNATAAARIYYQALTDFVSGAVQATDFADTARWLNCGAIHTTDFGQQPLRVGNFRTQHHVRNFGNVASRTSGSSTITAPDSWYGEVWGRGGAINAAWANYFKTRTGGTLASFTTWGDYRPQSLAASDAADSPLLNRVPQDFAVSPFDLLGVTRLNNGTGAAGPYERSA